MKNGLSGTNICELLSLSYHVKVHFYFLYIETIIHLNSSSAKNMTLNHAENLL